MIKRDSSVASVYKIKNSTSLDNPDLPKNVVGTGVVNLPKISKSEMPSKQSALKRSKFSTGNFWESYGKRVRQNVSDFRRTENAKGITPFDTAVGKFDEYTSDTQFLRNNAVGVKAVGSAKDNSNDKKFNKDWQVVRTRANEQPIVKYNTTEGVITLPKTYTGKFVNLAPSLGIKVGKNETPQTLKHKVQRKLGRYSDALDNSTELEHQERLRTGLEVKSLTELTAPSLASVAGKSEPKKEVISPVEQHLKLSQNRNIIDSVDSKKVVETMKGWQDEYAGTEIQAAIKEKEDAKKFLEEKAVSDARIKKNEAKFIARNVRTVQGGEDKLQTKADVLEGKKSMTIVATDKKGNPIYSNKILPASKFERKVEVSTEGKIKTTHTGNVNPVYEKGVEATAPWAAAGNKAFVDLTPLKIAKESGGDVKMAAAKIGTKTSIDVNANTPKSASQHQMNVLMRTTSGPKMSTKDRIALMKATAVRRPKNNTTPTNMFPESLATTIAKEDVAEFGKKKIMPSHDVPLTGKGAETKKSFVIKPSRRKNK